MRHTLVLAAGLSALFSTAALAQSSSAPPPPPAQASAGDQNTDLDCRRQAASQSGYNSNTPANSEVSHRYADAYYSCMDAAYGPPSSSYAYGPPPPPYYGPAPYPYYYPPYYGPGVSFGFRFGGYHRWR